LLDELSLGVRKIGSQKFSPLALTTRGRRQIAPPQLDFIAESLIHVVGEMDLRTVAMGM
jgi:hypothetical protein